MKREKQQVAHVTLDNFFEEPEGGQTLEALLARTERFEQCLGRHGHGWERPSADEAVLLSSTAPSNSSGMNMLNMDWAERLRDDIRQSIFLDSCWHSRDSARSQNLVSPGEAARSPRASAWL